MNTFNLSLARDIFCPNIFQTLTCISEKKTLSLSSEVDCSKNHEVQRKQHVYIKRMKAKRSTEKDHNLFIYYFQSPKYTFQRK